MKEKDSKEYLEGKKKRSMRRVTRASEIVNEREGRNKKINKTRSEKIIAKKEGKMMRREDD